MNVLEALTNHYNSYDEDARLLSQHGQVEFLTTVRYVEKYLFPHARILEIGAGTGRYSHYFAQMGYRVDALELIPHNIDIFRQNTKGNEPVTICQGNATDLSIFDNDVYDITLLLGPMYHLFTHQEKEQALQEAIRVTKPGGKLFIAYCMSDPSVMMYAFGKNMIHHLIEKELVDPITYETKSTPEELFVLYRKEEIDRLAAPLPATRLHFIGTDMYTCYFRSMIDSMDKNTYQRYLQFHLSICERKDMTGFSHHTLDVLEKLPLFPDFS
ncbi:MAG: class I SAM-dependent methyltransferase [Clostridiales bacterium]|nr:class I SAM-dependent methyltransferase [Clostridiales bacterium]